MLSRRSFLKATGAAAAVACPLCRPVFAAEGPHWTYEEADRWGDMSPEFRACGFGTEQSPIDLSHPIPAGLGDVAIEWRPGAATVVNNGHTIQVRPAPGSAVTIAGSSFEMEQFHFHHPAEHTVNGVRRVMEAHFVHANAAGGAAAIGVFLVAGGDDAAPAGATLAKVFGRMPTDVGEAATDGPINPTDLLPDVRAYYRYAGSLTTPPCGETVLWTIFAEPVEVPEAQIAAFAGLYSMNARPLQKLNRRFLLGSF